MRRARFMSGVEALLSRHATTSTVRQNPPPQQHLLPCPAALSAYASAAPPCVSVWIGETQAPKDHTSEIPNQKPFLGDQAKLNLAAVLDSGRIQTHAKFGPLCEEILQNDLGVQKALLVGSGTGAQP